MPNERIEYLENSISRKEERIIELEQERIPYTNEYVGKLEQEVQELKNWKELHSSSALAEENIRIWKTVENLKNQQNEFIKYLEDEIKHLEHSRYISFNEFGEHKLMFYKEILSKYKEIIGDVEDAKL